MRGGQEDTGDEQVLLVWTARWKEPKSNKITSSSNIGALTIRIKWLIFFIILTSLLLCSVDDDDDDMVIITTTMRIKSFLLSNFEMRENLDGKISCGSFFMLFKLFS